MKNHSPSTTNYTLQVISPVNKGDRHNRTLFKLKAEDGSQSQEFNSAAELLDRIQQPDTFKSSEQPHLHQEQTVTDAFDPQKQIELLEVLIKTNKSKLKELRFIVTDRITSAMTRTTLLKTGSSGKFTDSEEKWLDESLNDLAQLSLAIEDWTRLCEIIDPKNLSSFDAVKSMVTNITSLN